MPDLPATNLSAVLVTVQSATEITLPAAIREAAHLKEGDLLEAEVTEAGAILLRPVGIPGREPTAEEETDILAAVDEARVAHAGRRRR